MELKAIFDDGSWIKGIRHPWFVFKESKGTHHLIVTDCNFEGQSIKGCEVAIPIIKPKCWIIGKEK